MATTLYRALLVVLLAMTISAAGQTPTSQGVTSQGPQEPVNRRPKVQNPKKVSHPMLSDIVCFGYYPNWSVQFQNGEARYVGMNQPDKYFSGTFRWVPEDKVWEWHRRNGTTPRNGPSGQYELSANITEAACTDPVKKTKYPYSGQVYLPQGDMVTGCCRKLPPGEAPVGPHGVPASQPTPPMRPSRPAGPQPGIPQNVPPPQ